MSLPENTGERILPEKETPLMVARHLSAYAFAAPYMRGRRVLDIACGEGYGSRYLADFAERLTAIDYEGPVIEHAARRYPKENLSFRRMDVKDLASLGERFSGICSFQFIEHLADARGFLNDVSTLLDKDGVFICSTPNKKDASPGSQTPLNPFHLKEYSLEEYLGLLEAHFRKVEVFGLKRGARLRFFLRLKKIGLPVKGVLKKAGTRDFVIVKKGLDSALDFIAVCGN